MTEPEDNREVRYWVVQIFLQLKRLINAAGDMLSVKVVQPVDGAGNVKVNVVGVTGSPIMTVRQETYTVIRSGEVAGSITAKQLPQLACKLVKIVAENDNAGNVYLGAAGVTVANGATDATTGLQLDGGQDSGWIPVADLNELFIICDNAGDDITYLAMVS